LPLEELRRAKRYSGVRNAPEATFEQVIGSGFTGMARRENGDLIDAENEGFIEAVKQTEALPVLKKLVENFEEGVRNNNSTK
jgi:hypothetical protein